jgi:hypothetical protein
MGTITRSFANLITASGPSSVPALETLTVDNIQFPATQVASANANNLDDYEEGTWTPIDSSGASLTFTNTSNNAYYTKIGDMVYASFRLTYPSTANGSTAIVGGLPFTSSGSMGVNTQPICLSEQNLDASAMGIMNTSASTFLFLTTNGTTVSVKTNANCSSKDFRGMAIYKI